MSVLTLSEQLIENHLHVISDNGEIKVAHGQCGNRFLKVTICYTQRSIVFTDGTTSERVIKSY
jgi:hypothetical protein